MGRTTNRVHGRPTCSSSCMISSAETGCFVRLRSIRRNLRRKPSPLRPSASFTTFFPPLSLPMPLVFRVIASLMLFHPPPCNLLGSMHPSAELSAQLWPSGGATEPPGCICSASLPSVLVLDRKAGRRCANHRPVAPSRRVHVTCAPHPPPPARVVLASNVALCHVAVRGGAVETRDGWTPHVRSWAGWLSGGWCSHMFHHGDGLMQLP